MNELKVCFVGVGSIAKRHIKNFYELCNQEKINLHIDAIRRNGNRGDDKIYEFIQNIYSNIEDLKMTYDIIFITNPTEYHIDTLEKITPYGKNFFIEKPISSFNQIRKIENYKMNETSIYYVACPLRYNAVIQYIKENIKLEDVFSVRSISSSYLPNWRPGQNYKDSYSAYTDLGGGVSIDLIHEWDYLTYLFGIPNKVKYMSGKISNLEIESEDFAIYIAQYNKKIIELHLDYFGRKAIREIMLFTENETIVGDILNNTIHFLENGKVINFSEERDDYQLRELKHFLTIILNGTKSDNDIKNAINILKLTQGEV